MYGLFICIPPQLIYLDKQMPVTIDNNALWH